MRVLLYILIWAAILFLPNRLLTTEPVHEYLGLIFLLLGGIHLILVRRYLRALITLRLRVTPLNIVNAVMLVLLVVVIATGIMISLYAVPVVRLRGLTSIYVHGTHLAAAVLFYLIVGIHVGFHWHAIWNAILRSFSLHIPASISRIFDALGVLLIIAGLHAFITTHIYEKILYEHLSFGGIVGTWQYQLDLALIFAACMSCAVFFERMRK
ncbi:hypothetical protein AXF19_00300 [Selenomonas sp. oral taxon 126]|uniref:DUF4405 domain-containing protein n=1 Tax=Selenomonas sp. oral taxon 126 TaxID=712528 RepID=UPI0008079F8F|nr:DUF4405 domain-containing protein [Selenomonas sp. oral taxon 126]ANR69592.1 hypothetical protein AXF19_00300 [Selenomonas sp. oral taxon 126]